ncbi:MAG: hypothetical protein QM804_14625 [Propionicimonas sp.]
MRRVYLAELRDSWPAWLGVSLVFVVVNACLAITAITYWTGDRAVAEGRLSQLDAAYYTISQVIVAVFLLFVAVPVIGSATALVVDSRRGSLARLALAGASPGQVRLTVTSQLAVVSLVCALIGAVIAIAGTGGWFWLTAYGYQSEPAFTLLDPLIAPVPILASCGLCVVVSVVAGSRQARAASLIPPVEALRQSQALPRSTRLRAGGWIKLVLLALLVLVSFGSVPFQVAHRYKETVSNLFILSYAQIFVWSALLAVIAPVLVKPVTRGWTRLVPSAAPTWQLARSTVSARADRLYKSVVPVMFSFAIGVGSLTIGDSGFRAITLYMGEPELSLPSWDSYLYLFGFPVLIAFAGGVGALIMMSKQRDAELALVAIVGATPRQRVLVPVLEAVIITVTGLLLSAVAIVPSVVFQAYALTAAGLPWRLELSAALVLGVFAGGLLLTGLATVLPTLPAQRLPEPRVIARLVAE